jgi:hypothetical protein
MKPQKVILIIDAAINLLLGILLLTFSAKTVQLLGVPTAKSNFYPNILGGVIFGIGIALLIECFKGPESLTGLGLSGAIAINLCGGLTLTTWLVWGELDIPIGGRIFLWALAVILIVVSGIELFVHTRAKSSP